MKKSFLLACSLLLAAFTARATHIIGGSMFHEYIGNDTWRIQLDMYRDCYNGEPYFDFSAAIGVFDESGALVQNLNAPFDPTLDDTLSLENVPVCFPQPTPVCIHRGRYIFNVTLPPTPGKTYRIVYQRCCRNVLVRNIAAPLDMGMTFMTTIRVDDKNSSARLKYPLPFYSFVNEPFVYDAGAIDPDGDSLVYRLSEVVNGAGNCQSCPPTDPTGPLPNPPSFSTYFPLPYIPPYSIDKIIGDSPHPLRIDAQTGELTALPQTIGYFVMGFDIDEYRNGALITTNHHEIALVVHDANYSPYIAGQVYRLLDDSSLVPMDSADVHLIRRNPINDSLGLMAQMPLDSGAHYRFDNVFTSKYYIRAVPTPGSAYYATTLPTYHPETYFWYNAIEVEVCDFSQPSIDVRIRSDSAFLARTGPGFVNGKLLDPAAQPLQGSEIWLMRTDNVLNAGVPLPFRWAQTDEKGEFRFDQLPLGQYLIFANELNTSILNEYPPVFDLSEDGDIALQLVLERQEDRLVVRSKQTMANSPQTSLLNLFPNPTQDRIGFIMPLGFVAASVFDAAGRQIQHGNTNHFSVKNLPQGVYWVEVKTTSGRFVAKFVKM